MKAKVYKTICLIVALMVAVFTVGYAFAWFLDRRDSKFVLSGASAGAYFDSGNGSKETPFVIANSTHMRNLAVLQNMGRFVDENGNPKIYYFEIKKTIDELDMGDGLWLPPIGNDEAPFIGVFNGNGKSIKNLKVTTDKTLLKEENYPIEASPTYKFSNAVGLFGNTGKSSEIRNFILNNPVLLVGSTSKTTYSTGAAKVVGLAVGHVAGMCQSIGVRATNDNETYLQVADADTQYSTFNSILGELGDGVQSSVTGGGYGNGSGGSGNAFGASFDVDGMYDRLVAIDANKKSATPAWRLPEVDASKNDGITLQTHEKLPFTVSSESTYEGADASEVIGNTNIGYLVGNQNKVYNKKVEFGDKLIKPGGTNVTNWHFPDGSIPADDKVIPRWIYKISAKDVGSDTYNDYTGFSALTDAEYKSLSQDILELIPTSNGEVENFNSVRLSQTYNNAGVQIYPGTTSNGQWSPHGQISWMGNTYGEGYTMTDYEGDAVDVNGIKYTAEGYKIDENGYMYSADGYFTSSNWPVPGTVDEEGYLIDGTERFLDADGDPVKYGGYDLGHDGSGYYLIKKDGTPLEWDKGWGRQRIEPKQGETVPFFRFQGGIALPNCGIWFKPSQAGTIRFVMYAEKAGNGFTLIKGTRTNATRDNPFYVDYSQSGDDVLTEEVAKYTMPSWVLFYYEFEVKQEDIDAGNVEYWLMQYGSGGAYFVYMDLGASAAEDTSAVVPDLVSAVDFIYDGVEITQEDVADTDIKIGDFIVNASGTVARYDSSKTSIYFEDLTAALKIVYVRLHNESTDKHSGKTICLEKSDPKLDTDSEVHATYATYVCPTISGGSGTVSGGGGGGGPVTPTPGPDDVAVTGVTISGAPATMTVGGTATLSAAVSPDNATNKTVTWSTTDSSIATVANGVVTAKAAGTVTITATAGGKTDSVTITVSAGTVETTWINFNGTDVSSNNDAYFTTSTVAQGGNAGNVNGTAFSKGMKINSSANIDFTTTGKVNIVIYMDAKKDTSIKVDGTVYSASAYTENGSTNVVVVTLELSAGNHTITRGSAEAAIYRIEITPI